MSEPLHTPIDTPTALCPRCRKRTDRILVYNVPMIVFLVVYVVWNVERVVGCPHCVRKALALRTLACIPLTNLFCWIALPVQVFYLASSFASTKPGIPPEYAHLIDAVPDVAKPQWKGNPDGRALRLMVALLILAIVVAATFLLPLLLGNRPGGKRAQTQPLWDWIIREDGRPQPDGAAVS